MDKENAGPIKARQSSEEEIMNIQRVGRYRSGMKIL
jgi:hypothetical protein